ITIPCWFVDRGGARPYGTLGRDRDRLKLREIAAPERPPVWRPAYDAKRAGDPRVVEAGLVRVVLVLPPENTAFILIAHISKEGLARIVEIVSSRDVPRALQATAVEHEGGARLVET